MIELTIYGHKHAKERTLHETKWASSWLGD